MLHEDDLLRLARQLVQGELPPGDFWRVVSAGPLAAEGVTLDLDRQRRCGYPEVIFGEGKTVATLTSIMQRLMAEDCPVLATRISPEKASTLIQWRPAAPAACAAGARRRCSASATALRIA